MIILSSMLQSAQQYQTHVYVKNKIMCFVDSTLPSMREVNAYNLLI